jgi:cysteinyl-tRNA synthetase
MEELYEIIYISHMISRGRAYTLNIPDIGEFVLAESKYYNIRKRPIQNENIKDSFKKHEDDFVVWMPSKNNELYKNSPWGNGVPSANLYVCCIYM